MTAAITSVANPRMKRLARLARRRHRDEDGVFVVEGPRLVARALAAGFVVEEAFGDGTVELDGLELTTVSPEVLDRVSYRDRSEGLIVVFIQQRVTLEEIVPAGPALVLVAENLEKPGNLGAILRTADAAGVDAVVTVPGEIDLFNPNAIRASTGAVFTVPVVPATITELTAWLNRRDIALVAADPDAETSLWDVDLAGSVALMVGAEDEGLTPEAKDAADVMVSIPMRGSVDSLNASVAMAILSQEALRQRSMP